MSIGPSFPIAASVAGASLAQTTGADAARSRQDVTAQQRGVQSTEHAEDAAGIARADGDDTQSNERDADGRLPWQLGAHASTGHATEPDAMAELNDTAVQSKDSTGQSGSQLDLTG